MIPDPNGCPRCGLATCPFPAADAAIEAQPHNSTTEEFYRLHDVLRAADRDCRARPAVDWQAVLRAERERVGVTVRVEGDEGMEGVDRYSGRLWRDLLPSPRAGVAVRGVVTDERTSREPAPLGSVITICAPVGHAIKEGDLVEVRPVAGAKEQG